MSNYIGPATLSQVGIQRIGVAGLAASVADGRVEWHGTFTPNGASPVNTGPATIDVGGRCATVPIQDWRFDGIRGTAVLLGQGKPPF